MITLVATSYEAEVLARQLTYPHGWGEPLRDGTGKAMWQGTPDEELLEELRCCQDKGLFAFEVGDDWKRLTCWKEGLERLYTVDVVACNAEAAQEVMNLTGWQLGTPDVDGARWHWAGRFNAMDPLAAYIYPLTATPGRIIIFIDAPDWKELCFPAWFDAPPAPAPEPTWASTDSIL